MVYRFSLLNTPLAKNVAEAENEIWRIKMITEEQLKEWEDTEKKATPGPWDIELIEDKSYADGSEVFDPEIYLGNGEYLTQVDAAFINQSRNALPLLIQAYREQQKLIEEQKKRRLKE